MLANIRSGMSAVMRLMCAISLVAITFAHVQGLASGYGVGGSVAYVLPDGTVPALCLPDPGGDRNGSTGLEHCEFCRIVSAVVVPEAPVSALPVTFPNETGYSIAYVGLVHPEPVLQSPPPRGPPTGIQTV